MHASKPPEAPTLTEAEAIAQEFKDYVYSVSHDLSGPIRAMVEFSRLLKSERSDAFTEEDLLYLSFIIKGGEKLQKMMQGLLSYSRLNTETHPFTNVDCNSIVGKCMVVLKSNYTISDSDVIIHKLPVIHSDAEHMTQLFSILLDNALKFHLPGAISQVEVSAEQKEKAWQFTVKDNGIGIEPTFHERIFKLFQRLHTDEEYPGVGMGLTLAHKIVHRYGGNIWVESSPGNGSAFSFTLPYNETATC